MFHMYEVTATTTFMRWLNGLRDAKAQTIIAARIERVKVGNFGDCKSVGDGVANSASPLGRGIGSIIRSRNARL
jgi:putative addiction module killer protein